MLLYRVSENTCVLVELLVTQVFFDNEFVDNGLNTALLFDKLSV